VKSNEAEPDTFLDFARDTELAGLRLSRRSEAKTEALGSSCRFSSDRRVTRAFGLVLLLAVASTRAQENPARSLSSRPMTTVPASRPASIYAFHSDHDPNGIGKFYMGREIAHVMGHAAADWLERPEREAEEAPGILMKALKLRNGEIICDLGAGSGYLTVRLAAAVGEKGRVKAVDVQPEMIELLKQRLDREKIENVDLILGDEKNPHLPASSVDTVLMVDVYHEFEYPYEMMEHIVRSLRPGGRVVFVEYRKEDPNVPIKTVHKMTADQVAKEMKAVGLSLRERIEVLPRQHILIFARPDATTQPSSAAS
jgi:ubiquinone/menaquinone biosynthesis C-methylase UbiE